MKFVKFYKFVISAAVQGSTHQKDLRVQIRINTYAEIEKLTWDWAAAETSLSAFWN